MKGGKYAKTLVKNQVNEIDPMRSIWRNDLPKFLELCMEMSFWFPSGWAPAC